MFILNSSQLVDAVNSLFHPKDKPSRPFDVISGVSSQGECMTNTGPVIKIHLQKHPVHEGRHVTVITFEDYLSQQYMDTVDSSVQSLLFQTLKKNSFNFMRLATLMPENHKQDKLPLPLLAHGNSNQSSNLYEATPHAHDIEKDVLKMTEFIYKFVDGVAADAIAMAQHTLCEFTDIEGKGIEDDPVARNDSPEDDKKINFKLGVDRPLDFPDTVTSHATRNKPYGAHSDTENRPGTHCNSCHHTHKESMRIWTPCFSWTTDDSQLPKSIISVQHLISSPDGQKMHCKYIGCFSSDSGKFEIPNSSHKDPVISVGGKCHAHLQGWASQGKLYHEVKPLNKLQNIVRLVMSPRKLQPFQETIDHQQHLFQTYGHHTLASEHKFDKVLDLLHGSGRVMSATRKKLNDISSPETTDKFQVEKKKGCKSPWPRVTFKDGELLEEEKPRRNAIVGMKASYSLSNIVRSIEVARDMYHERCSLQFQAGNNSSMIVGPEVIVDDVGNHLLLKPGDFIDPMAVDVSSGISSNKKMKRVIKKSDGDVLHLRRAGKNHSSVLQNLLVCLNGQGTLITMIVRGAGAALSLAGQYPVSSCCSSSFREAPTHVVSSGQNVHDPTSLAIAECVHNHRCLNVFYNGCYLGPYHVTESRYRAVTQTELKKDDAKLRDLIGKIHTISPGLHSKTSSKNMMLEMASMCAPGYWFTLEPLQKDMLSLWKSNGDIVSWKLHTVREDDFVRPSYCFSKCKISQLFGVGDGTTNMGVGASTSIDDVTFTDVSSILRHGKNFPYLTRNAVERLFPNHNTGIKVSGLESVRSVGHQQITLRHVMSAAVHSAAVTAAKASGRTTCGDGNIIPPRFLLEEIRSNHFKHMTYREKMQHTNLKPLLTLPTHPWYLGDEPTVVIAAMSTDSFNPILRELDDAGHWKHRRGRDYILSKDTCKEAWGIMFKCIIASFLSASAIHLILSIIATNTLIQKFTLPDPDSPLFFCSLTQY